MLAIERAAARHRQEARAALDRDDCAEARARAARACALHRSPESLTALALVALADRDFPAAIRLWREVRAGSAPAGRQ